MFTIWLSDYKYFSRNNGFNLFRIFHFQNHSLFVIQWELKIISFEQNIENLILSRNMIYQPYREIDLLYNQ